MPCGDECDIINAVGRDNLGAIGNIDRRDHRSNRREAMKEYININGVDLVSGVNVLNIKYPAGYTTYMRSGTPADTVIIIAVLPAIPLD